MSPCSGQNIEGISLTSRSPLTLPAIRCHHRSQFRRLTNGRIRPLSIALYISFPECVMPVSVQSNNNHVISWQCCHGNIQWRQWRTSNRRTVRCNL